MLEIDNDKERRDIKLGDYIDGECPQCQRNRLMLGDDKKRRCEKCGWCIEDESYDSDVL
jgi:ribosomal protein L37AE/L43A